MTIDCLIIDEPLIPKCGRLFFYSGIFFIKVEVLSTNPEKSPIWAFSLPVTYLCRLSSLSEHCALHVTCLNTCMVVPSYLLLTKDKFQRWINNPAWNFVGEQNFCDCVQYCRGSKYRINNWLASSLLECQPATQVAEVWFLTETCLSWGALQ